MRTGIDIEPDSCKGGVLSQCAFVRCTTPVTNLHQADTNTFSNLVIRNVSAVNNSHGGFVISPSLMSFDAGSKQFTRPSKLQIAFEDCLIDSRGQKRVQWQDNLGSLVFSSFPPAMTGTIDVRGLTVLGGVTPAVQGWAISPSVRTTIRDSNLEHVANCGLE